MEQKTNISNFTHLFYLLPFMIFKNTFKSATEK